MNTQSMSVWPSLTDDDIEAAVEVLRSSRLTQTSSAAVGRFETLLSTHHEGAQAVAVSSGTAALHLALKALDIGPGDEVIVPAHTFVGSASPVIHVGATPVFADVSMETYCINLEHIEPLVTPRTKAVVVVHLNGYPVTMGKLVKFCHDRGIRVIEDCAQALGSLGDSQPVGLAGDIACLSFFEQKVVTCAGEGGALVTQSRQWATRARALRSHGEVPEPSGFIWSVEPGFNFRMTAVCAAVGSSQLSRLGDYVSARTRIADSYTTGLSDQEHVITPSTPQIGHHSFWKYVLRFPTQELTESVMAALKNNGIPTMFRYPYALTQLPAFWRDQTLATPTNAATISRTTLTLPNHPNVSSHDISVALTTIREVLSQKGTLP